MQKKSQYPWEIIVITVFKISLNTLSTISVLLNTSVYTAKGTAVTTYIPFN